MKKNREEITTFLKEVSSYDLEIDRKNSLKFIRYLSNIWKDDPNINYNSPLWVGWKVTPRCDMECKHCWANLHGEDQSLEKMLNVAKKLADAGVIHITLTGGEPFMRKDLFQIIKYLKSRRIFIEIFSNGSLINSEKAKKLSSLLDLESDTVQISLDGACAETHDMQRKKGSFERVIKAIKNLKNNSIKVRVNYTATPINTNEIVDSYRLVSNLGIDIFSVTPVYPSGRGTEMVPSMNYSDYLDQVLSCHKMKKNNEDLTSLRIFSPIPLLYYSDKFIKKDVNSLFRLEEGHLYWSIDSIGDVYPSIDLYLPELLGGNIYKDSIQTIQSNFKRILGYRDLSNTKCSNCKHLSFCQGGDLGRVFRMYNHFNEKDPECLY
ncbi:MULTISPECIES: radical SAM/SPASM domain-containing protein [unclassified Bacillus cereus group]|uniref:radical SAM/SPASM domain-containing protein n=1 Tax=unclassified Bacillus cereus group TaxID=2750818 RepID=UPI001F598896|nr:MULTISPECIES: radical SAM protein [unclassified Bacillus cereus group]